MFCTQCGKKLKPDWRFCQQCGIALFNESKKRVSPAKRPIRIIKKAKSKKIAKKPQTRRSRSDFWNAYRLLPQGQSYEQNDSIRKKLFLEFLEEQITIAKNGSEKKDLSAWAKELKKTRKEWPKEGPSIDRDNRRSLFDSSVMTDQPMKASKYSK